MKMSNKMCTRTLHAYSFLVDQLDISWYTLLRNYKYDGSYSGPVSCWSFNDLIVDHVAIQWFKCTVHLSKIVILSKISQKHV